MVKALESVRSDLMKEAILSRQFDLDNDMDLEIEYDVYSCEQNELPPSPPAMSLTPQHFITDNYVHPPSPLPSTTSQHIKVIDDNKGKNSEHHENSCANKNGHAISLAVKMNHLNQKNTIWLPMSRP